MVKQGRPVVFTEKRIAEIVKLIEEYTDNTPVPIVAEFAYLNNIRRQSLYDHAGLSDAVKRMIDKKEFQLEKLAMANKINGTFAIFSLKQLGWSDKHEIEHSGHVKYSELTDEELDAKIEALE